MQLIGVKPSLEVDFRFVAVGYVPSGRREIKEIIRELKDTE